MAKHEQDQLYVTNPTAEYFAWPWAGQSYGIEPGQQIIWPRFLAEHYAKHLADHILLRREKEDKDKYVSANHGSDKDYRPKSLLNSKKERPAVLTTILTGVYSYFRPQRKDDPNALLQRQIAQMNPQPDPKEPKPLDLGMVDDDRATGVLQEEEEPLTPDEIGIDPAGNPSAAPPATNEANTPVLPGQTAIPIDDKPKANTKRTRAQLFEEAQQLGLKPTPEMSNEEVQELIKKFFA